MHEEAILRDLVRKVDEVARAAGGRPVVRVRLRVGALAHLTGPQAETRWPDLARGTWGAGARIEVDAGTDVSDPDAQRVRLVSVDIEEATGL